MMTKTIKCISIMALLSGFLFNPIMSVTLPHAMFLGLVAACILTFLASLAFSKRRRILTIPSITNCRPRNESL